MTTHRFARSALAAALVVVYVGAAAIGVVPGLGWYFEREFMRDLVGCSMRLGSPERSVDSPRAFNGDGFSAARYALRDAIPECLCDARRTVDLPARLGRSC